MALYDKAMRCTKKSGSTLLFREVGGACKAKHTKNYLDVNSIVARDISTNSQDEIAKMIAVVEVMLCEKTKNNVVREIDLDMRMAS